MSKRIRKLVLLLFCVILFYALYVAPIFLEYRGANCFSPDDPRRESYHTDYIWGLRWVKWKDTTFCKISPPVQDFGSQDYHSGDDCKNPPKPIPLPGQWQFSHTTVKTKYWNVRLYYFALTTTNRYHGRIGWRWDDLGNFFVPTVSIKAIPFQWEVHLWYHTVS